MQKLLKLLVGVSLLFLLSPLAQGTTFQVAYTGMGPSEITQVWGGGQSGLYCYSGRINLSIDDQKTSGFCIDLEQHASSTPTKYTELPLPKYLSNDQVQYFESLYAEHYKVLCSAQENSAFQMAIWEILYEDAPKDPKEYDVTVDGTAGLGGFFCRGGSTNLANGWLRVLGQSLEGSEVSVLHSKDYQDYSIASVPEPATVALMFLCLPLALARPAKKHFWEKKRCCRCDRIIPLTSWKCPHCRWGWLEGL